jgi:malonyl-CoA O-methyltransferase
MLRVAGRRRAWLRPFALLCADATRLPLADASIDLAFSNLLLPWCDPDALFTELRRVLAPRGLLTLTGLGPDTLKELRAAWAQADGHTHVNRFIDMHDIGETLVRAGLAEPVLDVDRIELAYPDTLALMRDLKAIGAHNVTAGRPRALTGRARLKRMSEAYEAFRRGDRLPATYEVIYGASWGAAGRAAAAAQAGEVLIAPGSIRRPEARSP